MIIMINHKSLSASSSLIENLSPRYILLASAPHQSSLQNVVHWKSWQILIFSLIFPGFSFFFSFSFYKLLCTERANSHLTKPYFEKEIISFPDRFLQMISPLYVFLCTLAKYRKIKLKIPEYKWQVTTLILIFLISFISLNNNVHNDPFSCKEIKNHFLKYSLLSLLLFSLRASYLLLINY